ncbi:TusE/DsrC/DsvC family sulfur relay protein [Halomonas denitrificans]|uniref:TusE/DsrC/DsvC family sulfur relay protein n=1 Tax=Halomonas TaxID=2745 RepID=UPI001A902AC7|nr:MULTISPECIES: TusE/DsrC/DsvC family sulfur relay protein [Halomonas]MED5294397.1 TusE/DsrC/DsvC family sulfur relay protein [Pseudomonadota bacterium]MBN8411299.1 TusE/DsrC/DsvC family sulfur relay protein [Halomonas litopenaei]MBY5925925.1 TusE/DsrC/DsvC family sulfur relay protein [Halomonas sp. DP4Y7-2]MBY5927657.1 TusE/DsrC/DsvC family sulfur relay protein [Halomonas sp. DP8Y7-3]MBY5969742.1 TusE/DsrC/DsvC family sulfur relay protein [Halomonas denitrificans]
MATTQTAEELNLGTGTIGLDPEGYLVDLNDWTPEVAEALAGREGLVLTEEHWEILHVLREFYGRYEQSPAMRPLVKAVGKALGQDKASSIYLMRLFPGSPPKLGARLAGLPKPTNCL